MRNTEILSANFLFRRGDYPVESISSLPISGKDGWQEVTLPHDWAIDGPFDGWNEPLITLDQENGTSRFSQGNSTGALPYTGCGIYVYHLILPETFREKVIQLEFDGVMSFSSVYLNGKKVGGCAYGYTSFMIDITPYAVLGEQGNLLVVRAENPIYLTRWYPGGGIYREVRLVTLEKEHFPHQGIQLHTESLDVKNRKAVLRVSAEGIDASKLSVKVFKDGKRIAEGGNKLELSGLELWSPELPALYQITVSSPTDSVTLTYGFREIIFDSEKGMLLNGEICRVKGLCMHHDLGVFGAAFDKSVMRWRLKKIKSLGCNALRMAHNPPDPKLLDLCDAMGFLVMDEAFDVWKKPKTAGDYHRIFEESCEFDLRSMIRRDRNHPCVFMWSIGNEIEDVLHPEGKDISAELVKLCHEEDPSRPVISAISHQREKDNEHLHAVADTLDIIGFNYQPNLYPLLHERFPGKPLVGSETAAVNTSRGEYYFPVQEILPPNKYYSSAYALEHAAWSSSSEAMFEALEKNPFMIGEFAWCTYDYLGEPFPFKYPARSSAWGLFDLAGLPKDRAFLYAAQWHRKGMDEVLHIVPHWDWNRGEKIPIHIFTSCRKVELFLNGRSLGTRERGVCCRLIWEDIVFEPGVLEAIGYNSDGKESARTRAVTPGKAAKIGTKVEVEKRENNKGVYTFIELFLTDQNDIIIEKSDAELSFRLEGGFLIGVDNGDSCSLLPFKRNHLKLYHGHAMMTAMFEEKGTVLISCGTLKKEIAVDLP